MQRAPYPVPGTPGLLIWQGMVLALAFGMVFTQSPVAALVALGLLLLSCFVGKRDGAVLWLKFPLHLAALFTLSFVFGAGWFAIQEPELEASPAWIEQVHGKKLLLKGIVDRVEALPDSRLRIRVSGVHPAGDETEGFATEPKVPTVPGKVQLTWDQPPDGIRPLPGQGITWKGNLRRISAFANEGVNDSAKYWSAQGIWFSSWCQKDKGEVSLQGKGRVGTALRESWRIAFVQNLMAMQQEQENYAGKGTLAPSLAIFPALLFGDRFYMQSSSMDLFVRANLVHSLALSGQHLSLAGAVALLLVLALGKGYSGAYLHCSRRVLLLVVSLPLALLYLWLGNAPSSLIRATVMLLAGAVLFLGKRSTTLLDILFAALAFFLLAKPTSLLDLGVQLSFLSVAGIALGMPLLKKIRIACLGGQRKQASQASWGLRAAVGALLLLCTSILVQLATLPVVIQAFGRVSLCFPLNVLWLPVLSLFVLPVGAVALVLVLLGAPDFLPQVLLGLAALPSEALLALLQWMNNTSFASYPSLLFVVQSLKSAPLSVLGYAVLLVAGAMWVGRVPGRPVSPLCPILLAAALCLLPMGTMERLLGELKQSFFQEVSLTMLDVGQGQSLVIQWPGGKMLVDAGGSFSARFDPGRDIVAHALTNNQAPRLSAIIPSHEDMDHSRGLVAIAEFFQVDKMFNSAWNLDAAKEHKPDYYRLKKMQTLRGTEVLSLRTGDVLQLCTVPDLKLEVLHPPEQGRFSSNNSSLVLRLVLEGEAVALMCGDVQEFALRSILEAGVKMNAQVLVLPHHGSATGWVPDFYEAVQPIMALASYGTYNSFGFPSTKVQEELERLHIPWHGTGKLGAIKITWRGKNPQKPRSCNFIGK